jgi:hypothetical protein
MTIDDFKPNTTIICVSGFPASTSRGVYIPCSKDDYYKIIYFGIVTSEIECISKRLKGIRYKFDTDIIIKYFITLKEYRKLKLDKINDSN